MGLYANNNQTTLQGWDGKQTDRPTSFMMTTKFKGLHVISHNQKRILKPNLNDVQLKYLEALGLEQTIFTESKPPVNNKKYFDSS